jgi:outer membrane receptor protein involved in Fe transport
LPAGSVLQPIVRSVQTFDGSSWLQAGYVHVQWNPSDRWSVSPGVRVAHSTLTDETIASPWAQGLWRVGQTSLRAGVGLYQQFPRFDQVLGSIGNPALTRERARHLDVGIEQRLGDGLQWQATFYDRDERDMIRLENAEPRLVNGVIPFPGPIRFANALTGSSRGVELSLARLDPNGLSGWISYAYGRAKYDDAITGESYWGDFDQRHIVNIYGQYRLTGRTNVSVKFRAGSNVPVAGYFVERDGGLFLSDQRNAVRLPTYARLDLRADRTFHFTRRRLTLYVEVLNVLDRTNLGPADGTVRVRTQEALGFVEQLFPLLPAAGFLIEF